MIKKNCQLCNKTFLAHNYRENLAHFCSTFCYNKFRAENAYPIKICPLCKKILKFIGKHETINTALVNALFLTKENISAMIKFALFAKKYFLFLPKIRPSRLSIITIKAFHWFFAIKIFIKTCKDGALNQEKAGWNYRFLKFQKAYIAIS